MKSDMRRLVRYQSEWNYYYLLFSDVTNSFLEIKQLNENSRCFLNSRKPLAYRLYKLSKIQLRGDMDITNFDETHKRTRYREKDIQTNLSKFNNTVLQLTWV